MPDNAVSILDSFLGDIEPLESESKKKELAELLYFISDRGFWPDGVSVSTHQCIMCWHVVEALKSNSLPPELAMR